MNSLISILRSQSVRLYDFNNFNDPLELVFANKYFSRQKNTDIELKEFKSQLFGLSLCEYNDENISNNINLWRLYANNGKGVCIVFEYNSDNHDLIYDYTFGKIKYYPVAETIPELEAIKKRAETHKKEHNFSCDNLDELLTPICCFYKSNLYEIENEVRLFHFSKKYPFKEHYDHEIRSDLNSQYQRVYYKELPIININDNTIPQLKIKEVLIGYNLKPEDKTELEFVVEKLNLPYRVPINWSPIKKHFL